MEKEVVGRFIDEDGIEKDVIYEEYGAIYPYIHTVRKVWGKPTKKGRRQPKYIEIKEKLGDDWETDLTDTWAEPKRLPKKIVRKLAKIFERG